MCNDSDLINNTMPLKLFSYNKHIFFIIDYNSLINIIGIK